MKIRLNRYLSMCGVSSRRNADELIKNGVVSINGEVVGGLGQTIDPETDEVRVNGNIVSPEQKRYIILNKPKLYITALGEGQDDKHTISKLISDIPERVYPVGRLDYDVEGLIVLTNDGELANRILHPSFELTKVYSAVVKGNVNREKSLQMEKGVELDDGFAKPDSLEILKTDSSSSSVLISFHEGRNHLVKRFFSKFDHPVKQLRRISVGPLNITNVKKGEWRDLTAKELQTLKKQLGVEN